MPETPKLIISTYQVPKNLESLEINMEANTIHPDSKPHQSQPILYEHKACQSFKSRLIKFYLRAANIKSSVAKKASLKQKKPDFVDKDEVPSPPKWLYKKLDVSSWQVNGSNVYRLAPKANKTKKHILFIHGGGYITNSLKYHWDFVQKLVKNHHCTVIYPDYPLAPEHNYVEIFAMIVSLYKQLINEVDQNDLIVMGDSAGGGCSLALAQKMKLENVRGPGQIILLSPWLDMTCSNPEIAEIDKIDPMIGIDGGKLAAKAFAGNADLNEYLFSPINGPVEGLGEISLFIGTHESFLADAKKFKALCNQKGVDINFFVYPKMIHIWTILGMPESNKAIEQIGNLINRNK